MFLKPNSDEAAEGGAANDPTILSPPLPEVLGEEREAAAAAVAADIAEGGLKGNVLMGTVVAMGDLSRYVAAVAVAAAAAD